MADKKTRLDQNRLDDIVAQARREKEAREQGYREQALKMYPWICGRCGREFNHKNVRELTVHHKNHNHDDNPADGSNWELLCLYCHDEEHSRYLNADLHGSDSTGQANSPATSHKPFAGLEALLKNRK